MSTTDTQLWQQLQEAGLVQGAEPPAREDRGYWYIRLMQGVGGWIGALFLLGFVGITLTFVIRSALLSGLGGLAACTVAALLYRHQGRSDFFCQFALALSLAGQGLVLVALFEQLDHQVAAIALSMALLQLLLFAGLDNFTHRVWSAGAGSIALIEAFLEWRWQAYVPGLLALACAWIWQQEFRLAHRGALLRAGGYGLSLVLLPSAPLLSWLTHAWYWHGAETAGPWPGHAWLGAALSGAALLWTSHYFLQREGIPGRSPAALALLALAALLAGANLKIPGLAPALMILLLGFGQGNRLLAGLGVAALLGGLAFYYYTLEASLLEKSAYMAATGLALLLGRLAARRLAGLAATDEEPGHG